MAPHTFANLGDEVIDLSVDRPYNIRSSIGQMRTRVQAFIESMEIKKIQGGVR